MGKDTNNYYDLGFADGIANVGDAEITYEQHYHSSACYQTVTEWHNATVWFYDSWSGEDKTHYRCNTCGIELTRNGDWSGVWYNAHSVQTTKCICGYSEGQIISATIKF